MRRLLLRLVVRWETLLVVAIVGVSIWSTTLSPFFLTRINLLDLITPYVFIGLMAFGLTFVVIAGEIDISVTAILAVSVVSFAQLLDHGLNVWIAALVGPRRRGRARPRERGARGARRTCPRSPSRSARSPPSRGSRSWSCPARAWPSSRRGT